jgi:quinol monooxygenase YgiN
MRQRSARELAPLRKKPARSKMAGLRRRWRAKTTRSVPELSKANTMIYVVATIELAEGNRDQFVALQRKLLPLVRAEAGCIEYVPTVDVAITDPPKPPLRANCVVVQEKWESLAALRAHAAAPHMKDFRGQTKGLVLNVKVEVFQPV